MSKNTVEMVIQARDEVGPGVDSARKKLNDLRATMDSERAGGMIGATIKFGAAVAGLQGGFQLIGAAVAAFRGDADAAGAALERLPLGIGGVIRELRALEGALDSPTKKLVEMHRAIEDFRFATEQQQGRTLLAGRSGLEAEIEKLNLAREAELKPLRDRLGQLDSLRSKQDDIEGTEIGKQIAAIKERYAIERDLARNADFEKQRDASQRFQKELDQLKTKNDERLKVELNAATQLRMKLKEENERFASEELANFYKRSDAMAEVDKSTAARTSLTAFFEQRGLLEAGLETPSMKTLGDLVNRVGRTSGPSALASGEQQRFTSGVRETAQEKVRSEAVESNRIAREQTELLKKLLSAAEKGAAVDPPPAINFGVLGGLY